MSEEKYSELFEWARAELKQLEGWKKDVIEQLAIKLENAGMPIGMICEEICDKLDGYGVSKSYIRSCLEEKYKNVKQIRKNPPEDRILQNAIDTKNIIEQSDTQANDSFPNNEIEEKPKERLQITATGQIEAEEELEDVNDYRGKSYGELTEEQKQKAYEDSKLDTRGEAAKQIDKFQQLQKQLEEKDLKINELRSGIQQALVNKRIESTTQQEQIDNLKKQLEEQKQMSNNDITIITLDFKKFSEFIKSCEPAGEYTKLLLHVNTKTGKMIKMDAE